MIFALEIGNTSISFGVYVNESLRFKAKLAADRNKSSDEYTATIAGIFGMKHISPEEIEGCILLSVVPALTHTLTAALKLLFKTEPLIVGSGIKTGLNIRVETPNLLGADIVANTVAALKIADAPLIVIDLGTVTTITVINEKIELCGCIIAQGARLSIDAMSEKCALLPEVSLTKPDKLLGTNTADCMNSGAVFGTALMLDGFINKIRNEYSFDSLNVIATGGLSKLIIPFCENKITLEPDLTLNGLSRLYSINVKTKGKR
jgi:type III pantothenate kinase